MSKETKKFTWATLKRIVNRMPEDRLKDEVVIWTDEERAFVVGGCERLAEDYIFDQDQGCAPRSAMKETIDEEKQSGTYDESDYYVVHPKGRRILYAE